MVLFLIYVRLEHHLWTLLQEQKAMDPFVIYGPQYSKLQEQMDIAAYSEDTGGLKGAVQVLLLQVGVYVYPYTLLCTFLLVGMCCRRV